MRGARATSKCTRPHCSRRIHLHRVGRSARLFPATHRAQPLGVCINYRHYPCQAADEGNQRETEMWVELDAQNDLRHDCKSSVAD